MAELSHGMLRGGWVADALLRLQQYVADDALCVVRSIDSTRAVEDLAHCLTAYGIPNRVVHGNVCVSGMALRTALAAEVFTGFDEVWVFLDSPPSEGISEVSGATSETTDFGNRVPEEVVEAMDRTQCILVLGDGCGLNYATTQGEIAQVLSSGVS